MSVLMKRATAAWLVRNTKLTVDQIAEFCECRPVEVMSISSGNILIEGMDPIVYGQLTNEEIKRCEADPSAKMVAKKSDEMFLSSKKDKRYIPRIHRKEKAGYIAWILKNYPEMPDKGIYWLLGTTAATLNRAKDNLEDAEIINPVLHRICTEQDINTALSFVSRSGKSHK